MSTDTGFYPLESRGSFRTRLMSVDYQAPGSFYPLESRGSFRTRAAGSARLALGFLSA